MNKKKTNEPKKKKKKKKVKIVFKCHKAHPIKVTILWCSGWAPINRIKVARLIPISPIFVDVGLIAGWVRWHINAITIVISATLRNFFLASYRRTVLEV